MSSCVKELTMSDRELIKSWFMDGCKENASHVIITEEEPNWWCVITMPVYIFPEQNIKDQINRFKGVKIVYILDLKEDMEEQIEIAMACFNSKSHMEN